MTKRTFNIVRFTLGLCVSFLLFMLTDYFILGSSLDTAMIFKNLLVAFPLSFIPFIPGRMSYKKIVSEEDADRVRDFIYCDGYKALIGIGDHEHYYNRVYLAGWDEIQIIPDNGQYVLRYTPYLKKKIDRLLNATHSESLVKI